MKYIDYTVTIEDLQQMSDYDLSKLFMYADRDRMSLKIAEEVYWLCVKIINERIKIKERGFIS